MYNNSVEMGREKMNRINKIRLDGFYPKSLKITKIIESERQITIELKSQKHSHACRKCGEEMTHYHGTYVRTVQDLPILGKSVKLKIYAYEYYCKNAECEVQSFTEEYGEFIGKSKRMTDRCEYLIKTIAYETNCEEAAMICGKMGIKVSGDTIIGMLKKEAENTARILCEKASKPTSIGVDDFAYRKGQTYCTIICDGESHQPIEVLEGRDGEALREWLKNNKQVKKVTRDRAGAYAKAISDILPEAMQIADRFHLHQNLLTAVNEALKCVVPNAIEIPNIIDNSEEKLSVDEMTEKTTNIINDILPEILSEPEHENMQYKKN